MNKIYNQRNKAFVRPENRDVLLRHFDLRPARANYLMNISPTYKFIYFETPKVACSTIKRTFQAAEAEALGVSLGKHLHERETSPLKSVMEINDNIQSILYKGEYFKFTFVRNPYPRVLSAYLDKIIQNEWERKRHLPLLGFAPDSYPSFLEFLQRIADQNPEDMDIHWCPQTVLTASKSIEMDFIGRFEHFASDFELLCNKILPNTASKGQIQKIAHHNTGASEKLRELINSDCQAIIKTIYADDFSTYNYSRDLFFA